MEKSFYLLPLIVDYLFFFIAEGKRFQYAAFDLTNVQVDINSSQLC